MLNQFPNPSEPSSSLRGPSPTSRRMMEEAYRKQRKGEGEFRRTLDKEGKPVSSEKEESSQSIFDLSKDQPKNIPQETQQKKKSPPSSPDTSKIKKEQPDTSPAKVLNPEEKKSPEKPLQPTDTRLEKQAMQSKEALQEKVERAFQKPDLILEPSEPSLTEEPALIEEPDLIPPDKKMGEVSKSVEKKSVPSQEVPPREQPRQEDKSSSNEKLKMKETESFARTGRQEKQLEAEKIERKESPSIDKKEKTSSSFSTSDSSKEPPVSALPAAANVQFDTSSPQSAPETSRSSATQTLVTHMIKQIEIMQKEDLTFTRVTLRSPPILEGATLTLEVSAHAQNEYNLSFGNLSNEGQLFLESKLKDHSLNNAMEEAGYVVHIVKTTTEDIPLFQEGNQQSSQERDQQQPRDQRRRPFQDQEEEE